MFVVGYRLTIRNNKKLYEPVYEVEVRRYRLYGFMYLNM